MLLNIFQIFKKIFKKCIDAHNDDPLANLCLFEADYAWVTTELCRIAAEKCAGRVVSTLEGGYDLNALAASAAAHVTALMAA